MNQNTIFALQTIGAKSFRPGFGGSWALIGSKGGNRDGCRQNCRTRMAGAAAIMSTLVAEPNTAVRVGNGMSRMSNSQNLSNVNDNDEKQNERDVAVDRQKKINKKERRKRRQRKILTGGGHHQIQEKKSENKDEVEEDDDDDEGTVEIEEMGSVRVQERRLASRGGRRITGYACKVKLPRAVPNFKEFMARPEQLKRRTETLEKSFIQESIRRRDVKNMNVMMSQKNRNHLNTMYQNNRHDVHRRVASGQQQKNGMHSSVSAPSLASGLNKRGGGSVHYDSRRTSGDAVGVLNFDKPMEGGGGGGSFNLPLL